MTSSSKKPSWWKKQEVKVISKEHNKHQFIAKPSNGIFARNEWSFVGSSDEAIEAVIAALIKKLSSSYKCGYVGRSAESRADGLPSNDAMIDCRDNGNNHIVHYNKSFNRFEWRQLFAGANIVFCHGSDYQAKAQVIIIDRKHKDHLQQVLPLQTNVQLVLLEGNDEELFHTVKQSLKEGNELPVYHLSETDKIASFFQSQLQDASPRLNGLVLAGGKSVRMGTDKGSLHWHGKEQRYYMADLLKSICEEVFISRRHGQLEELDNDYQTIEDSFTGLGPYGAILSAFREQPDRAWLVTACDMPLINAETLQHLIKNRNVSAMATTFESPGGNFPEPLITIWEPKSYPILLSMLSQGYSCPRKALESNDVCLLKAPDPTVLMNVNTPEERQIAESILSVVKKD